MAKDDGLILTLPEPLAEEVRRAVERGDYSTATDVVSAALNVWIERGSPPSMTTSRLRQLVEEAERSGEEEGDFDLDALLAEARGTVQGKH
jgi:Arc/MetJ-type ribon-helix-helix transcriptional regulator